MGEEGGTKVDGKVGSLGGKIYRNQGALGEAGTTVKSRSLVCACPSLLQGIWPPEVLFHDSSSQKQLPDSC